jgi:hypothetical protein
MIGGEGNETFRGKGGDDRFIFEFNANGMGHDRVLDYTVGDWFGGTDSLAFAGGEGQMTTEQVEHDGITTFYSYNLEGNLIHTLDVSAVGVPPIGHIDFV